MLDETPPHRERTTVTAHTVLRLSGGTIEASLTVPAAAVPLGRLVPVAQALANAIVEVTTHTVEATGRTVSCRAGCGACCRQLVPIAPAEARKILDLVESLPEPRRSEVWARFVEARQRLEAAGLLESLAQLSHMDTDQRRLLGLDYFRQQVPCPFLEDESCSIHPDRPIACREYLVTSAPTYCTWRVPNAVEGVRMPTSVWKALAAMEDRIDAEARPPLVPLVLALEWADVHRDDAPVRPGPELLRELLERVTRTVGVIPPAPEPAVDFSRPLDRGGTLEE